MAVEPSARPGPNEAGKEAILEAAAEAFMTSGFNGTSIDDIADLLGATKGRVYHYFRSKADIHIAIVSSIVDLMLEEMSEIATGPGTPSERLQLMAERHARLLLERPSFARVALIHTENYVTRSQRQERAQKQILAVRAAYEQCFRDVVREGIDAGEFRDVDVRLAVKPVLGALNWVALWYRRDEERLTVDQIAIELATFAVAGLRQPSS